MNSLLSFGILVSLILGAGANEFPCDKITDEQDFYCQDVGYCYADLNTAECFPDTCIVAGTDCGEGCTLKFMNSDYDCETETVVNQTDFYCTNSFHNRIDVCFYNFLKTGNCDTGVGCKTISLEGKSSCINNVSPSSHDPCNDFTTEHCEFYSSYCFLQDGKCVTDECRYYSLWDDDTGKCSNESCVGSDVYEQDSETGDYTLQKICSHPDHAYDKCSHIDFSETVTTVGTCTVEEYDNELCTAYDGCRVVTLDGYSACSSRDPPPSSADTSRIPSIFTFLFMAVLTLTIISD